MKHSTSPVINLASEPFRRERADTAAFTLVNGALLGCLLGLSGLIWHAHTQAGDLRGRIDQQEVRLHNLRRQQSQYNLVLNRPENATTFATSVFLNQIIARRGVSWTRVFKDLGTVMPSNIRLLAIRLPLVESGDERAASRVQLDMMVGTTQPESVIGLFKNLQKSDLFGSASMVSQTPPSQNDPLYKYRITVPYDQKL